MTLDQIDAITIAACRIDMLRAMAEMLAEQIGHLGGSDPAAAISGLGFMADQIAHALRAVAAEART